MLGKLLLVLSPLSILLGAFTNDMTKTHIYNPRWPPHAKFHSGQTMSMSVALFLASVYYTFRNNADVAAVRESLFAALIFDSLYCVTGLSAILYPGTGWTDPEFGNRRDQLYAFSGNWVIAVVGWWLETRSM